MTFYAHGYPKGHEGLSRKSLCEERKIEVKRNSLQYTTKFKGGLNHEL